MNESLKKQMKPYLQEFLRRPADLALEIRRGWPCYSENVFLLIFGADDRFLLIPVGLLAQDEVDSSAVRMKGPAPWLLLLQGRPIWLLCLPSWLMLADSAALFDQARPPVPVSLFLTLPHVTFPRCSFSSRAKGFFERGHCVFVTDLWGANCSSLVSKNDQCSLELFNFVPLHSGTFTGQMPKISGSRWLDWMGGTESG